MQIHSDNVAAPAYKFVTCLQKTGHATLVVFCTLRSER